MLVTDVNVLVYAFDGGSRYHREYADWLGDALAGTEPVALLDTVLSGFVRIVTNARIFTAPVTALSAMEFVTAVIDAPSTRWLPPSASTWTAFRDFAETDAGLHGNHIPDAYLASIAVAHGARLATADRGFSRYRGLTWFDPVPR